MSIPLEIIGLSKIFNKKGEAKEIIDRLLNENDLSTDHKQSLQEMQGMSVS